MKSLLLIGMFLFIGVNLQEVPLPQSDIFLGEVGSYFDSNEQGDWLTDLDTDSVGDCAVHCNMNPTCGRLNIMTTSIIVNYFKLNLLPIRSVTILRDSLTSATFNCIGRCSRHSTNHAMLVSTIDI